MKTYKAIENYNAISSSSLELMGMKKDIKSFELEKFYDFGEIMINENFVSTIRKNRNVNLFVPEYSIDDFICFFFKRKIVLTEKINTNTFIHFIEKKFWNDIIIFKIDVDEEVDDLPKFYVFQDVIANFVKLNNENVEIMIPFI
jgi:hypothetical protein